ncbi:MAG: hypothetical protein KBT36_00030 [Kurthia sp.]|nr:hypothetical protein [Candidatus Kurthia equi]
MNGVSIIIALLLFLLLGTALYKGIFRRNKINNPYTSEFEDITSGNKPTMDGRNPITQTKEKVQQETKDEDLLKINQANEQLMHPQSLDDLTEEQQTTVLDEHASNEFQNVNNEFSHAGTLDDIEEVQAETFDKIEPTDTAFNETAAKDEMTTDFTDEDQTVATNFEENVAAELTAEAQAEIYEEPTTEILGEGFEGPVEEEPTSFEELAQEEEVNAFEPEPTSFHPDMEEPEELSPEVIGEGFEGPEEAEPTSFEELAQEEDTKALDQFVDEQAEKTEDFAEADPLNERFKETEDFNKEQVNLKNKDEPKA